MTAAAANGPSLDPADSNIDSCAHCQGHVGALVSWTSNLLLVFTSNLLVLFTTIFHHHYPRDKHA